MNAYNTYNTNHEISKEMSFQAVSKVLSEKKEYYLGAHKVNETLHCEFSEDKNTNLNCEFAD